MIETQKLIQEILKENKQYTQTELYNLIHNI